MEHAGLCLLASSCQIVGSIQLCTQVSDALRAAALGLLYGEPVVLVSGPPSGSTEPKTLQQRSRRLVFDLQQMLAEIPHANHPVRMCQLDPGFAGELLSLGSPEPAVALCAQLPLMLLADWRGQMQAAAGHAVHRILMRGSRENSACWGAACCWSASLGIESSRAVQS